MKNHRDVAALGVLVVAGLTPVSMAGCGEGAGETEATTSGTDGGAGQGGNGAGGEGGSTPLTPWQKYCASKTERDEKCDPANPPADYSACAEKESTCKDLFYGPALEGLATCLVTECGSDDPCYSDATNAAPEYGAFKIACETKFDGCPEIGNKVDDICWGTAAVSSSLIGELNACLDKSCTEVMGCWYAVFDKEEACGD